MLLYIGDMAPYFVKIIPLLTAVVNIVGRISSQKRNKMTAYSFDKPKSDLTITVMPLKK